jgi:hypothetical protein
MTKKASILAAEWLEMRKAISAIFQQHHGERVLARARINGQPNGYRPISEAELQASRMKDAA